MIVEVAVPWARRAIQANIYPPRAPSKNIIFPACRV